MNEKAIRLDDIPQELADSIRLVYSYMDELATLPSERYFQSRIMPKKGDPKNRLKTFVKRVGRLKMKFGLIPSFIESLGKIDKATQPRLYRYMVALYLDVIKYDIPNAAEKSGLRRIIERRVRKITGNYMK